MRTVPLHGCSNDAEAIGQLLARNGDGSPNFEVRLKKNIATKRWILGTGGRYLRQMWLDLLRCAMWCCRWMPPCSGESVPIFPHADGSRKAVLENGGQRENQS